MEVNALMGISSEVEIHQWSPPAMLERRSQVAETCRCPSFAVPSRVYAVCLLLLDLVACRLILRRIAFHRIALHHVALRNVSVPETSSVPRAMACWTVTPWSVD